jgi:hypothetical protein
MQDRIIKDGEGDAWFLRNFEPWPPQKEFPVDVDYVRSCLGHFAPNISQLLEIGCSAGIKLAMHQEVFKCDVNGIDPSSQAISKAKSLFPGESFSFQTGN